MKKMLILLAIALLSVMVVMPVSGQNAATDTSREALITDGDPVIGIVSTAGDSCTGGYTHQDGTVENGYRAATFTGSTFVEQFTAPAGNDWTLATACICWSSLGSLASGSYEIVVFDDDGAGGQPGTEIYSFADTALAVPVFSGVQWYSSALTLLVPDGETFYIGARWDANQDLFFCSDESGTTALQTGYRSTDGGATWGTIQVSHSSYRAMGIAFTLESAIPAVNYPNAGEILISAGAPVVAYGAAGDYPTGIVLPADYDGNGFDTYIVTKTATVAGATWYAIWVGGADYVWVPAAQVQVLR